MAAKRVPSRARLPDPSRMSVIYEYFELRGMGNNHLASCARLEITPRGMADRIYLARTRGEDVPAVPEGKTLYDDWTE